MAICKAKVRAWNALHWIHGAGPRIVLKRLRYLAPVISEMLNPAALEEVVGTLFPEDEVESRELIPFE